LLLVRKGLLAGEECDQEKRERKRESMKKEEELGVERKKALYFMPSSVTPISAL
jgi:hypothetical protein